MPAPTPRGGHPARLERGGRRVKAPTLPLRRRVRARAREGAPAKLRTSPARLQALAAPDSVLIASTNEGSKGLADTSRPLTGLGADGSRGVSP